MPPMHDLATVVAAAASRTGLQLGRTKALDELKADCFDTDAECYAFARAVLKALTPADYIDNGSPTIHGPQGQVDDFDSYAVRLDSALLARHGLSKETTWYVKLTLRTHGQQKVFCLSIHRLKSLEMRRVGGWLYPEW